MAWTASGSILLTNDWQYTEPIPSGSFFRFKHTEAPNGGLFAIAQCQIDADSKLSLIDSQVLAVEKPITDVLEFPFPGCFSERRIAIKKLSKQPSLQQELRRLFLPGYLQPTEEEIRVVSRSNWAIEVEVSDFIEPTTVVDFAPILTKLDAINNKIDNLQTTSGDSTGGTSGSTASYSSLVIADNPYLYWRFGESSGIGATDSSGNNRNGIYNNVTLGEPSSITNDPTNKSITLNGTNSKVYTSNAFSALTTFTFGIRFKTSTPSQGLIEFSNSQNPSQTYCPSLYIDGVGKLVFYTYGGAFIEITSPNSYNDNLWHSAIAVLSSSGMKLFVDGVLVANSNNTLTESYVGYWAVGFSNRNGRYFNGSLDEFFVNNVALSDARIASYHSVATAQ